MFKELRAKLDDIVRNDKRTVVNLTGVPTPYLEFQMPLKALQMKGLLEAKYGRSCILQQVNDAAGKFKFKQTEVKVLLDMFKQLGMILYFPEIDGCDKFISLKTQWVIDAMSCVIREEELHGSLLQDLLDDDPSDENQVWHRTPTKVVWNENDVKRGWFPVGLIDFIWEHSTKYGKLKATKNEVNFLKKLLTHFHLFHRVTRREDEFFVVPALVPEAPPLAPPPTLENNEELPDLPACVAWELHRVRQQYGQRVGVFEFKFDFKDEDYFPDDLFESLACAVATKISDKFSDNPVRFLVDFYHREATFGFNEHYIHAKKDPLSMRVFSINCGAGNHTTAQYSLQVFQKCASELLQKYEVDLGYVADGKYTHATVPNNEVVYSGDGCLQLNSVGIEAQQIWNGKPDLDNMDMRWIKQVLIVLYQIPKTEIVFYSVLVHIYIDTHPSGKKLDCCFDF